MAKSKIPKLPDLIKSKIYKTGQTRGADDDVVFQNRVNRNSTVLIPFDVFDYFRVAPDNNGVFENGLIVLINPTDYFEKENFQIALIGKGIELGINALLFYETRGQWNNDNPETKDLGFATSRQNPLGGMYVARVPSTTSKTDEKINRGFTTSGLKGAGIRVYEYASSETIKKCMFQLELLYWMCIDSKEISLKAGMSDEDIKSRISFIKEMAKELGLDDKSIFKEARIIDSDEHTVCPLCLEKLSASGFYNRLEQAEGRAVPDLTVTQLNLFHIRELRIGEFNHKPYNLGWGHHHCNTVTKDSGIKETLKWMAEIVDKNESLGYKIRQKE